MIKEFFFAENPEKWEDYIDIDEMECKEYLRFTDSHLCTQ